MVKSSDATIGLSSVEMKSQMKASDPISRFADRKGPVIAVRHNDEKVSTKRNPMHIDEVDDVSVMDLVRDDIQLAS